MNKRSKYDVAALHHFNLLCLLVAMYAQMNIYAEKFSEPFVVNEMNSECGKISK